MAGDEPRDMLTVTKTTYTFNEAIAEMKRRDRNPTTTKPIQWVNAKTGKKVYIGYNN